MIKISSFPPLEFLLNCIAAIFGPVLFESEFWNLFHSRTLEGTYVKQIALSATVAFLLGSFVFYRWKYATSKWIWVLGVCGFALRAIFLRGFTPPEQGYIVSVTLDVASVRMVCYSLGAACASLFVARMRARAG